MTTVGIRWLGQVTFVARALTGATTCTVAEAVIGGGANQPDVPSPAPRAEIDRYCPSIGRGLMVSGIRAGRPHNLEPLARLIELMIASWLAAIVGAWLLPSRPFGCGRH